MTKEDAKFIQDTYETMIILNIGDKFSGAPSSYLYIDNGIIHSFNLNTFIDKIYASAILRPVTTITIQ